MARGKKVNNEEVIEDPAHSAGVNDPDGAAQTATSDAQGGAEKTGSIVKKKYAGRYKDHRDGLSKFIAEHCALDGEFDYGLFFDLCRANGIKEEQIDPYKDILDPEKKINGLAGRTRMTLRNRLAAIVRKNEGRIKDAEGNEHHTETAPITVRTPTMDKAKEVTSDGDTAETAASHETEEVIA